MSDRRIDRRALVGRHDVVLTALDPRAPLSVGNGELACTVDVTGLHTLAAAYPAPGRYGEPAGSLLGTQSQWGWHRTPRDPEPDLAVAVRPYASPRGTVGYVDLSGRTSTTAGDGGTTDEQWLRNNPHRLMLVEVTLDPGCVGLPSTGRDAVGVAHLGPVRQRLDLWTGTVHSRSRVAGRPLRVTTAAHPGRDALAWRVEGPDRPALRLRFPYGSQAWGNAADWTAPERHATTLEPRGRGRWRIERALDADGYALLLGAPDAEVSVVGPHELRVATDGPLELVLELAPRAEDLAADGDLDVDAVLDASARHWARFWDEGGAVELADSDHPDAGELERRTVLSAYQTAVHCAGSLPPQETGLMVSSWRGRFHLEMHWWHAAHFPLWGRSELLERSLGWYADVLDRARATATGQGLTGARWPKQVGPDGRESPSDIGPFLLWQQPHPIHLAELVRRSRPDDPAVLERHGEVVLATAEAMASLATRPDGSVHLGPPLVPSQECYADLRREATDPTFELAAWCWALTVAQEWRGRLGLPAEPRWRHVVDALPAPTRLGNRYAALATPPHLRRRDHPSMVAALGVLPRTRLVDDATMAATLDDVEADWDWASTWGWDYPMLAMTATRLGRPAQAVRLLMRPEAKNVYLANGHNHQTDALPIYLPGNGGLLTAVALMAAGWDGSSDRPGFGPGWRVRHDRVARLPGP